MSTIELLTEVFWSLVHPWLFMYMSLQFLPGTIIRLVRQRDFTVLFSLQRLRSAWFGDFWSVAGSNIRQNRGPVVLSLLEGRVSAGKETDKQVVVPIGGVVIEVGSGSGIWVSLFASRNGEGSVASGVDIPGDTSLRGGMGRVTRVYGVEPNTDVHPELHRRIKEAGMEEIYQVVPVGIESLNDPSKWNGEIEKGSVDCIVSILSLCSIPEPEKNIKELYGYLKKGGRWYVYEHIKVEKYWGMNLYQAFVNIFWPSFIGGCELRRRTEKWLREAGPWERIDLAPPPEETWYSTLPHAFGTLTK